MKLLSEHIRKNRLKEFISVGAIFPYAEKEISTETILGFLREHPDFDKPFLTSVKQINQIDLAFGYYLKTGQEIKYKTIWGDYTTELLEFPPNEHNIDEFIKQLQENMIQEVLKVMVQLDDKDQDDIIDLIKERAEQARKELFGDDYDQ